MMGELQGKILLLGANGMLARMVARQAPSGCSVKGVDLPEFDLTDRRQVFETVSDASPDVIVNCAAYTDVDGCESNVDLAMRVNGDSVGILAEAARSSGATLVHISTDYVFSGDGDTPWTEESSPAPRSAYGRSKMAGEEAIRTSGLERHYIVRTSWLYGPGGRNFVETMLRLGREREELRVVCDQQGTPTFTVDLARALFRLLERNAPYGLYHYSNSGHCSWYDFAVEIFRQARERSLDLRVRSIVPIRTSEFPLPAERPAYSVLSKQKYIEAAGHTPPDWKDALRRYFEMREMT